MTTVSFALIFLTILFNLAFAVINKDSEKFDQLQNWEDHKDPNLDPYASEKRGVHMASLTASQKVGKYGPILLSDTNLLESLSNFVHERIPERVVHAKGGGAHGIFEVTHDVTRYTKMSIFSSIGKKTQALVRFSTTNGESGTATTVRDNLGFAAKFYTDEGIWNYAGLHVPAFKINDPMLFPMMIHANKRNPQTGMKDATMSWDFLSSRPETTLNTLMTYSDLGTPDGFRFIDGFSQHTYKLVNATGHVCYARVNFLSNQGLRNLTAAEASKLSSTKPDYSVSDLFNAIARGDYPSWTLALQILTEDQVRDSPFNVFDLTKILPQSQYPMTPVGRLVLNKNPLNFFQEIENVAFSPADFVPGIEGSEHDRILQARAFAYPDAQRYRLGSNFGQLPINRPRENLYNDHDGARLYSYLRDGACVQENFEDGVNYYPNSYGGPGVDPNAKESTFRVDGVVSRYEYEHPDDFSQAKEFLLGLSQWEKERLLQNLAKSLSTVPKFIWERQLANFGKVDEAFSTKLKQYIQKLIM